MLGMIQAHTNESLLQKCSRLLLCLEVKRFFETFHFLCAFCVHFVCMKRVQNVRFTVRIQGERSLLNCSDLPGFYASLMPKKT